MRYRHGLRHTPEYAIWCGIKKRCHNPNYHKYCDYGARGIYVCDKWRHNPAAFVADMGLRPSAQHSIHRIDNDGPYSPENCIWVTPKEQVQNRRLRCDSHFGVPGIYVDKRNGRFGVLFCKKYVGSFKTLNEAIAARRKAERDSEPAYQSMLNHERERGEDDGSTYADPRDERERLIHGD